MSTTSNSQPSLSELARTYVESRRRGSIISTREAVRAIKQKLVKGGGGRNDRELADLVAVEAVRSGRNVSFDLQLEI